MSDLAQKFAINCNSADPAKPAPHGGKGRIKRHSQTMLYRIEAAHRAGKRKKVSALVPIYLNSHDARLAATELASRTMKPHRRLPKTLVPSIASRLDAWTGTTEEVRVNLIPKGSDPDDRRIIMDFGPKSRALQYLVKDLLKTLADLHPHQFGTGNGGLHAAIKQVAQAMQDGYVWAVEIDIENCFLSFDADEVAGHLPLPKEVTERVLLSRHLKLVPGNLLDLLGGVSGGVHEDVPYGVPHTPHFGPAGGLGILGAKVLAEARQGIPQGSAASPLVAEMLLSLSLKQLPNMGRVFGYVDNFLIMAKSEADAVSMAKALGCALEAHPAGPLRPKLKGYFCAGQPIDFLGHRHTPHQQTVLIEPHPSNRKEFEDKVKNELSCLHGKSLSSTARARKLRELEAYVRSL
jgi:hypothetical protein